MAHFTGHLAHLRQVFFLEYSDEFFERVYNKFVKSLSAYNLRHNDVG